MFKPNGTRRKKKALIKLPLNTKKDTQLPQQTTIKKEIPLAEQPPKQATLEPEKQPVLKAETAKEPTSNLVTKPLSGVLFSDNISIKPPVFKSEDEPKIIDFDNLPKTPFTQDEFIKVWNAYKNILLSNGKFNLASIFEYLPQTENNQISILIENRALEEDFLNQKGDFLEFVRKELNNYAFDFTTSINKDTSTKKAYTPEEKYAKMIEKNPILATLKQKLDLEIGY